MYQIALCDDNKAFLDVAEKRVRKYCLDRGIQAAFELFDDSDRLAERIEERKGFDAYILDVEMPNCSGMKLTELIRKHSEYSYIIFLTAYDKYAVKACGINVLGYVLKEEIDEEFDNTLNSLFKQLDRAKKEKIYTIHNLRKHIRISQAEIIYIYKDQKNAVFVLEGDRKEWERVTLQEVYKKLDNPNLYVLDRGLILNLQHIRKIIGDTVWMKDGYRLSANQGKINALKEYLILNAGE